MNLPSTKEILQGEWLHRLKGNCLLVVLVLALVGSVSAARYWDDGDAGNNFWSDPNNWTVNSTPSISDTTYIRINDLVEGGDGPLIQAGMNAVCKRLSFEVDETGETLTMVMTGGTLTVGSTTDDYFRLGAGGGPGTVVLDMTGGTITISGLLRVGSFYTAHLNLWDGTIDTFELDVSDGPTSYIDIRNGGTLIVDGDVRSQIEDHVEDREVIAYGGAGELVISYSSANDKTTVTAIAPMRAYEPNPIEFATGIDPNATLGWAPGDGADSHNVYFGTEWNRVDNATTGDGEYVGNQTSNRIARTAYHSSGPLDLAKNYYWRIDEIDGGTTTKGEVWSFSTDSFVGAGYSVPNPVLYKVADSGVMKYNGEYYILGTDTYGDMYSSKNLVNWGQKTHVFSMNNAWATGTDGDDERIHACDVQYLDGVFHLYWSVNLDTVKGIGHATSTSGPLGPYTEPVTANMFGTKIDPALFIDDDGTPYFYTVKFPHGNVSYGQAMSDPWTLIGTDYWLIDGYTGGGDWETDDGSHINEGPEVMTYRDTYYLLYADNTTVGCVESSGPLAFNGDDKYLDPVIELITRGGHTITETGQANMLRGPNGFEWWVVYFVEYDGGATCQAIDRVLFFDRRFYMAGPSSNLGSYTGLTYTPPPAAPTLGDLFNEGTALSAHWEVLSGTWDVSNGEARQTAPTGSDNAALIKSAPARNYLVESGIKLTDPYAPGEKAGVVAYYEDSTNWMVVALDQKNGSWYYNKVEAGTSTVVGYPLPGGFDFSVYHTIRVAKNNTDFQVWIDERPAPGNPVISTGFDDIGLPGLYTQTARASFDGFIYTIGWDEYDDEITGWGNAELGTGQTGSWSTGGNGIETTDDSTTSRIYKGDLLSQYEFMTQVTRTSTVPVDGADHTMGIYATYIDPSSWMIAVIDLAEDKLKVYGRKDGINLDDVEAVVESADSYNLRVIKRDDATRIFVDGELKITVPMYWGPSQVGLRAEGVAARFNGITQFGLGSQYGDSAPINEVVGDNFDDSIFSAKWQQVSIHADDVSKHGHDALPDIVITETNRRLQFSSCEQGFDSSPWYGRGLKYVDPIQGSSTVEIDFDSLLAYSEEGASRAAIGLRIWKDPDHWFEIRQTDDDDGDRLQTVTVNGGVKTTSSVVSSVSSGSFKIEFNNSSGIAECFLNGSSKGMVNMSGMMDSTYYVYITAYTSGTGNRIACNVDNMSISSFSPAAVSYMEWAASYGLGDTNGTGALTFDVEPDGMDNLAEYALGGNPTSNDAASILPTYGITDVGGGSNVLDYIYNRRLDAALRGLTYGLNESTNLLSDWIYVGTAYETGSADIDSSFESVTNTIPIITKKGFINLEVNGNF